VGTNRNLKYLTQEEFFFSVVVPTYRRPHELRKLLEALSQQTFAKDKFQVIVVDDGGAIPLDAIIAPFQRVLNLTLVRQKNTGPAGARNFGSSFANGAFLAFTDDDCRPDPNWLQVLADYLEQSPQTLCGGRTRNALVNNPFAQATQDLADYVYREYKPAHNVGAFFLTNNLALPRKDFLEIGGFDPSLRFGEDRELCRRWTWHRWPLVYIPDALVYHSHPLQLASFLRLHFSYGTGTFQFKKRCAQKGLDPARLSPPSYYVNLLLYGVRKEKNRQGLLISMLLILSQLCYAAGYAWEAARSLRSIRSSLNDP
jgi:glycosyltransferase involved in cell wall biosynthesis